MNELMARALSTEELAQEFRYHDDPGVVKLARAIVDGEIASRDYESELETMEFQYDEAKCQIEELELETTDLKDLLRECLDELTDDSDDLRSRIRAALG